MQAQVLAVAQHVDLDALSWMGIRYLRAWRFAATRGCGPARQVPRNKAITWKGNCTVHDSDGPEFDALKARFYRDLSEAIRPGDVPGQTLFAKFLDSPRRVILEVDPVQRIGYDGAKMGKATAEWVASQSST